MGTLVGTVQAVDPDGDNVSFALEGDGPFAIDSRSGRITVTGAVDYERVSHYVLLVRAADNGDPARSTQGAVTINVGDLNESPVAEAKITASPRLQSVRGLPAIVKNGSRIAGESATF